MDFTFYINLQNEPDLHEVAQYLKDPLSKLERLKIILKQFSSNIETKESIDKVNKLENKYLPQLFDNYCQLSLDYRNNVTIKEEYINGNLKKYTAKDILLKNLSKLIEEINLLSQKYPQTLLIKNALHDVEIETQKEAISIKPEILIKQKKPNIFRTIKHELYLFMNNGILFDIYLVVLYIILAMIGIWNIYPLVNNPQTTFRGVEAISHEVHKMYPDKNYAGLSTENLLKNNVAKDYINTKILNTNYKEYKNGYEGKMNVKSVSIGQNNDNFIVTTDKLDSRGCNVVTRYLQQNHPHLVKANGHIVIQDGFLDEKLLKSACSLEKNTLEVIPNDNI